ncbi:Hypothetical predicted protein [Marmota monax]|uniref:Uncharacterized protein n=1 Tax=Marmota monax TaxID=9995 RepID=A0A5E4AXF1_MARMO|nr:Hypothetical predicted protein [Marmota monax]
MPGFLSEAFGSATATVPGRGSASLAASLRAPQISSGEVARCFATFSSCSQPLPPYKYEENSRQRYDCCPSTTAQELFMQIITTLGKGDTIQRAERMGATRPGPLQ